MLLDPASVCGATVVFDLDGTLVDTAPDLVATLNFLLVREGLGTLNITEVRSMIGAGARALIARGFAAAGTRLTPERAERLFGDFVARYRDHIADESRPFPGVSTALDRLAAAGARLAVCTNKPTNLSVALLETLNLAHRFAAIVGPDAAPAPKPDPRHLIAAVEAAGGEPSRAILVGDSATDARAARAAGIPLILVSFGYTDIPARDLAPDILIDHFSAVPEACARLLTPCRLTAEPL